MERYITDEELYELIDSAEDLDFCKALYACSDDQACGECPYGIDEDCRSIESMMYRAADKIVSLLKTVKTMQPKTAKWILEKEVDPHGGATFYRWTCSNCGFIKRRGATLDDIEDTISKAKPNAKYCECCGAKIFDACGAKRNDKTIKALGMCQGGRIGLCSDCPYFDFYTTSYDCHREMCNDAINLIESMRGSVAKGDK